LISLDNNQKSLHQMATTYITLPKETKNTQTARKGSTLNFQVDQAFDA